MNTYSEEVKQELREVLWDILDKEYIGDRGICSRIIWADISYYTESRKLFKSIIKQWKYFSGDIDYPIPSSRMSPEKAFSLLPKYEGEYGESRIQAVIFVLQELGV